MSVIIHLDRPHKHFTNLDYLTGKVVLQLHSEAAIGGIQVKLEGESRTRLAGPKNPHNEQSDKKRTEIEVHKVRILRHFPLAFSSVSIRDAKQNICVMPFNASDTDQLV